MMIFIPACKNKKTESHSQEISETSQLYTCSMHPQIIRDKPGNCPICEMKLVKKIDNGQKVDGIEMEDLLKPTNEFVTTTVPVTTIQTQIEQIAIEAIGNIQKDAREIGSVSAIVAGRIEKLYVRYRYQMVQRGEKIMEIYSPEIATAQQNLLFLLKNDRTNLSLINAARQRLLLMGMSSKQLNQLVTTEKAALTIGIYSKIQGHIHEAGQERMDAAGNMQISSLTTAPLTIREGMYVQQGQRIFSLTNPHRAWAVLNIFPENQHYVKVGNGVKIVPEAMPQKAFGAQINFIEPFYRQGSKTLTARVYFDNSQRQIPIGSQVRASIYGNTTLANWLPKDAVLSLGINDVVFLKKSGGFIAHKIQTGIRKENSVQVINGLSITDTVASNAQYLTDSESFIKTK